MKEKLKSLWPVMSRALFGILLLSFGTLVMQVVITCRIQTMESRIAKLELLAKLQSKTQRNKEP